MTKQKYLAAIIGFLTIDEIRRSAASPSAHMTPMHVKLHYIALRRLTGVNFGDTQ